MGETYELPVVSDDELLELEERVRMACANRSLDGLSVFGFGEVSIALGWPTKEPRFVAKRMYPMPDAAAVDEPLLAIDPFAAHVEASGRKVLPYETRRIQRPDGNHVGYLVQPIVPKEELAETVLKTDTPAANHPLLIAVRDFVVACAEDDRALDAQIPNFAWRDGEVWLLDITTPAGFDANGKLEYPMLELSQQLVPKPLAGAFTKAATDIFTLYRGVEGALTQIVVFLHRVGADAWVEPAIETFNSVLDDPIQLSVVQERWEQNVKDFPRIKKVLTIERAWREKVRRKPFEFLIADSFTGEIL
jgi:hypothetical protein